MKMLTLGPELKLPLNFATEGVAVIGMRGSGKSTTETRWCEVLHEVGVPFVVVDPKGDWGGIRSSADGKKPGLPIPVFGGITGDFPLTEHLGARIADLLVDQNLSAVLDVSLLSKEKRARFLTEFFDRLMERHQHEPHVRCVVMEESHRYIPQVIPQGPPNDKGLYARLKEAAAAVLLEGRAWGLGCWAATQRPARLHKDVLEEVGTAIIHRIGVAASNDLRTVSGWVKHEDLGDEIIPTLTKLKAGEAWVLAPATLGIALRVQIDRRTTFDSASTPIVGAGSRPTVTMADIDVAAINEALSDAIERAKAMDPAELNRRIKELEAELARVPAQAEPRVEYVETVVEVVPPAVWELVETLRESAMSASEAEAAGRSAYKGIDMAMVAIESLRNAQPVRRDPVAAVAPPGHREAPSRPAPKSRAVSPPPTGTPSSGDLTGPERKVLTILAQHGGTLMHDPLAIWAGYQPKKSTLGVVVGKLRSKGYLDPAKGDESISISDAGRSALGSWEALPSGAALLEHHRSRLSGPEVRLLDAFIDAWPSELDHDSLCAATGYDPEKSTVGVILGKLRKMGLVVDWRLETALGEAIDH